MRIVIGIDGSRAAIRASEFVERRTWPGGTRVTLIGAVEPVVDWTGMARVAGAELESEGAALGLVLEERASVLRTHGLTVETAVEVGRAADVLIDRAAETFADLLIVGSRGLGPAASLVLGSVSAHLVDHAGCPVLVVRLPEATRMLLATDGTPSSHTIPRVLAAWGPAFRGLPVEVVSVAPHDRFVTPWGTTGDDDDMPSDSELVLHERIAEQVADEMLGLGWEAAAVTREGDPARQIISAGLDWGADLIVTGSRGIGTLRRIIAGSVAHDVLLHGRSSVLVVRGQVPARVSRTVPVLAGVR
jgi:nucleotide-binding universal stress UspA family protein